MNTSFLSPNMTPLNFGSVNYVESVCKEYVTNLNQYLFYLVIFNMIYFLFARRLFNKFQDIDFKLFKINIKNVIENIVDLINVMICGYYLIFTYNQTIINNIDLIWFVIKILIFLTILIIGYKMRYEIMKIFSMMKEEIIKDENKKINEDNQNDKTTTKKE